MLEFFENLALEFIVEILAQSLTAPFLILLGWVLGKKSTPLAHLSAEWASQTWYIFLRRHLRLLATCLMLLVSLAIFFFPLESHLKRRQALKASFLAEIQEQRRCREVILGFFTKYASTHGASVPSEQAVFRFCQERY